MEAVFNTAKIMPKGQITIPADIRKKMGLSVGDRLALISDGTRIIIMNPAVYAMDALHATMDGEWEKAGIHSEDDLFDLLSEVREARRSKK